jgi:GTP pyrophosphokinase
MSLWRLGIDVQSWDDLRAKLAKRLAPEGLRRVERAMALWEGKQPAAPREYAHSISVAAILDDLRADAVTLAAALLIRLPGLDVESLQNGRSTRPPRREKSSNQAEEQPLDPEVAGLLRNLQALDVLREFRTRGHRLTRRDAEALRRVFLVMAQDIRGVVIKLAQRIVELRNISELPEEEREPLCNETMSIYAPLANRLGIWQLKWELEDRSFAVLEPQVFGQIISYLRARRAQREAFVEELCRTIAEHIARAGIDARVRGRPKHIYSIWLKMKRKGLPMERIYDATALRVLTNSIEDCYRVLGVVHSLWAPIPGEFDDYIANPKPNGYRSIHTAVYGPGNKPVEVQIRTHEMDRDAEFGLAAHWRYKEPTAATEDHRVLQLRSMLDWSRSIDGIHHAKDGGARADLSSLFDDRVIVFTPKNELVDLPAGATPLDFAYYVHTLVGHRCRGARVNGKLVPLKTPLKTGDRVEILTGKHPNPSRDWLEPGAGFLKTSAARAKVRSWFRQQDRSQNISAGREMIEKELKRFGGSISLSDLARKLKQETVEDLFAAVGYGDISLSRVAGAAAQLHKQATTREEPPAPEEEEPSTERRTAEGRDKDFRGLLMHTARCCNPLPGDPIKGFITRGRGLSIHRADCRNLAAFADSARMIEISWSDVIIEAYPARLRIHGLPRAGLLRDIAASINETGVNIRALKARTLEREDRATVVVSIDVPSVEKLDSVIRKLKTVPAVLRAERI